MEAEVTSKENLTILSSQTDPQFNSEVQNVLSDFEKLDFKDNKCFDKIAIDYKEKGTSSLFNYVILNKLKEIINILDKNLPHLEEQEEFRKKYGQYILQIDKGMSYGKELLDRLWSFEDRAGEVLSDFKKLNFNFKDNCENSSDSINYNKGRPADPFDKIANYYRWNKDIFLFNYVILNKRKEIMDILDNKLISKDQEQLKKKFKNRLGRYLLRIKEGMSDAEELLGRDDIMGFFDGRFWPDKEAGCPVNHYDNLSINITKPGQSLEASCLFSKKIKRMEITKNEIQRVKIYSNHKRIVTIEKNDKQQRNYSFTKFSICELEISWSAKDELEKVLNYTIVLNINSGQISIGKSTIDGKNVEPKDILELVNQNEAVLIKGKALHAVLAEHLTTQTPCEKEKNTQLCESTILPDSGTSDSVLDDEEFCMLEVDEALIVQ